MNRSCLRPVTGVVLHPQQNVIGAAIAAAIHALRFQEGCVSMHIGITNLSRRSQEQFERKMIRSFPFLTKSPIFDCWEECEAVIDRPQTPVQCPPVLGNDCHGTST